MNIRRYRIKEFMYGHVPEIIWYIKMVIKLNVKDYIIFVFVSFEWILCRRFYLTIIRGKSNRLS